jgi:hypothetical protein
MYEAVGDDHRVVRGDAIQRAEETDRIDMLADARSLLVDLTLARIVTRAQLRDPAGAASSIADTLRQRLEREACIADQGNVGPAIQPRVLRAAIGRDQRCRSPHVAPVVEAEITRHSREQHAVGFAQRVATRMPHLQRMRRAQQPARHTGQVYRDAETGHGAGDGRRVLGDQQRLAADHQHGPPCARQRFGRARNRRVGSPRRLDCNRGRLAGVAGAVEHPRRMPV